MPGKESRPVDGKGCPRCGFSVYEAEKMIAAQRVWIFQLKVKMISLHWFSHKLQSWHKRCFTCATETCNRHLDSTTVNDGPDGEIYCKSCYSAKFGIKGYGFGKGASTPALLSVNPFSNSVTEFLNSNFLMSWFLRMGLFADPNRTARWTMSTKCAQKLHLYCHNSVFCQATAFTKLTLFTVAWADRKYMITQKKIYKHLSDKNIAKSMFCCLGWIWIRIWSTHQWIMEKS